MDSDSDFYGDERTVSSLHQRVDSLDLSASRHAFNAAVMPPAGRQELTASSQPPGQLYDTPKKDPDRRHLSETVDAFLARRPPATTDFQATGLPWLWISDPRAPPEPKPDVELLTRVGSERLQRFSDFMVETRATKTKYHSGREISKERKVVVEDLIALAAASDVVCGKWMLFPEPGAVNRVWGVVAHATANGELGPVSKVATRNGAGNDEARLICVYTKDFRDKADVARVLNRLRQLDLVKEEGKSIYYKSDAWTYLSLYSKNEWNIAASTYTSKDKFKYIKDEGLTWVL